MYAATPPTTYLVWWPTIRVFKVGYSDRQRYRIFQLRGAEVLALMEFSDAGVALEFEANCHRALWKRCAAAFASATEAAPYLGAGGGGYRECFSMPAGLASHEISGYIDAALDAEIAC